MGCFLCCFPVCRSLYCQLLCSCLCPKLVFQFAFFLCGAFPHKGFVIQFIVGILVGFELPVPQAGVSVRILLMRSFSPQGFLLFSSLLAFLLVLSFSLSVSRFSPEFFLLDGCISCVVGLRFSPQGFLQFRCVSFLLSIC